MTLPYHHRTTVHIEANIPTKYPGNEQKHHERRRRHEHRRLVQPRDRLAYQFVCADDTSTMSACRQQPYPAQPSSCQQEPQQTKAVVEIEICYCQQRLFVFGFFVVSGRQERPPRQDRANSGGRWQYFRQRQQQNQSYRSCTCTCLCVCLGPVRSPPETTIKPTPTERWYWYQP